MITLEIYFKIHDADMSGGPESVVYSSTKLDFDIEVLAGKDLHAIVETARKNAANMCGVDVENVTIISRTDYEEETEDDWDYDWGDDLDTDWDDDLDTDWDD